MEIKDRTQSASWRWSLLLSVVSLNICLPSLVLSYGVLLLHSVNLGMPTWLGLSTPAIFILTYGLTQCWCREAADSWGGSIGYRVMATLGLTLIVASLFSCALTPYHLQPYVYGVLGGFGSSLISAQIEAVIFDTYDTRLGIIRGLILTGQAIGQSVFPHIMTALIDCYGYSLSYIVLSGIILQTLPAIMFLKVDDTIKRPVSFSRYSDLSKTYALFNNDLSNSYRITELQLYDLSKKCWKSPSDDNLHSEEYLEGDDAEDECIPTITPPPSPEEKRRNIYGVEILPEIPEESEESEDSDDDEQNITGKNVNTHKNRLSAAIKRLSTLGDNFDEYIAKQSRRDSQNERENRDYTEIEVIYDNISPITDIQREKIFNSFSFRCQSAYANMRRRLWMPSYRVYKLRRRFLYLMYSINDTFIKPLTRSLSCWRFYPAVILYFSELSLKAVSLTLMPLIAAHVQPKISLSESNFLMSLHGFTWLCFLLSTPWLAQTPKRNFKYVAGFGLIVSTTACFVLANASNHDSYSIGCVIAGFGYGAICSCWEGTVQDFVGARKWPKFHSSLETISAMLLATFVFGLSYVIEDEYGLHYSMYILGITLFIITFIWLIILAVSIYTMKIRSYMLSKRCLWIF